MSSLPRLVKNLIKKYLSILQLRIFYKFWAITGIYLTSQYRLTASNIEVAQKDLATSQTIKFISYTYFQTIKSTQVNQKIIYKK